MLRMTQALTIKDLYENEELSLREISRRTHLSFQTVRKYAYQEDWSEKALPNIEPKNYPVLENFIPFVDKWLESDRLAKPKQRHTFRKIYDQLRDKKGYKGSYSSVKRYARKKKYLLKQNPAGCLPLAQPKGHAQIDFGEFSYYTPDGVAHDAYTLTITFPYSNKGYIQVFPSQNQECLLTGMQRIFEHIGGVPPRVRADNMSTAVSKVLKGRKRILTDGYARFMLHYGFRTDFCNPAAGNEKGNVENKVGYGRRNALVPVPTIESFDTFNEQLWDWCGKDAQRLHYKHKVPIQELWEEERGVLLALPEHPYQVFRYEVLRVNKTGFVVIDTNNYGLSPTLYGEKVQAKIFYDRIQFFHDHDLVGEYRRSYGQAEDLMDWTQYVETLCKKPGAVEDTRFFQQMPQAWREHLARTTGTERKNALELLKEIVIDGNAARCTNVLSLAGKNGRTDTDSIRQCYYLLSRGPNVPEPLDLDMVAPVLNYRPNLSEYDALTGGEAHGRAN